MHVTHGPEIWRRFPSLKAGVLFAPDVPQDGSRSTAALLQPYYDRAADRLAGGPESDLPEIQAWRRTFSAMGLKPTQYRCAAEALLRRFRKERSLPSLAPAIDLCNAVSLAYAVPIAVFDVEQIDTGIEVRPATGTEVYETFSGEREHPETGEVIFADRSGNAHARRWTNRQSARSAVRAGTRSVLVVAEALHDTAADDVARLITELAQDLRTVWNTEPTTTLLEAEGSQFTFPP